MKSVIYLQTKKTVGRRGQLLDKCIDMRHDWTIIVNTHVDQGSTSDIVRRRHDDAHECE